MYKVSFRPYFRVPARLNGRRRLLGKSWYKPLGPFNPPVSFTLLKKHFVICVFSVKTITTTLPLLCLVPPGSNTFSRRRYWYFRRKVRHVKSCFFPVIIIYRNRKTPETFWDILEKMSSRQPSNREKNLWLTLIIILQVKVTHDWHKVYNTKYNWQNS